MAPDAHRGRSQLVLAAAGIAAFVTAATGVGLNLATPRSPKVSLDTTVDRPSVVTAANSPVIARNPRWTANLVVAHRTDRPGFSGSLHSSLDGGHTWRATSLPLPPGVDRPFAPDLAFAPDGTLFVVYSNLAGRGNRPANLWMSTSTDGGRTLRPPVRVAGELTFQARVAVGPRGPVHVTWLQAPETGVLRFVGDPVVVVATSLDGGRTFSPPVRVSDGNRPRVGAAVPAVDPDGRLLVLYEDFKDDRRDFEFLEGPPYDGTFALVLAVSGDGGRTFAPGTEVDSDIVPLRRFLAYLPDFPSLAVAGDHHLYVAWADGRNGDDDVFVRRSDDGGRSWAPPVRVNDNRLRDGTTQTLPSVAVAPGGRLDVVFYDRRRDPGPNALSDVTLASSGDGGRSWRNTTVTDVRFDARIGPVTDERFGPDFGTRLGLTSSRRQTWAVWADTRFASQTTGGQDIELTKVNHPGTVPLIGRWLVVASLVVFGVAALAGSRQRPRTDEPMMDETR